LRAAVEELVIREAIRRHNKMIDAQVRMAVTIDNVI
jgi:hypothetical protein